MILRAYSVIYKFKLLHYLFLFLTLLTGQTGTWIELPNAPVVTRFNDIQFLNEKTNQFINQSRQLILQAQGEKYSLVVTELIRAKGITLLLYGGQESQVGYHDKSYDITQDVIDAMNEKED